MWNCGTAMIHFLLFFPSRTNRPKTALCVWVYVVYALQNVIESLSTDFVKSNSFFGKRKWDKRNDTTSAAERRKNWPNKTFSDRLNHFYVLVIRFVFRRFTLSFYRFIQRHTKTSAPIRNTNNMKCGHKNKDRRRERERKSNLQKKMIVSSVSHPRRLWCVSISHSDFILSFGRRSSLRSEFVYMSWGRGWTTDSDLRLHVYEDTRAEQHIYRKKMMHIDRFAWVFFYDMRP